MNQERFIQVDRNIFNIEDIIRARIEHEHLTIVTRDINDSENHRIDYNLDSKEAQELFAWLRQQTKVLVSDLDIKVPDRKIQVAEEDNDDIPTF